MKISLASKVLRFSLIMGVALLVAGSFLIVNYDTTKADPPEMVTLCHADGQSGTTKFSTLTIAYNAAFGQAGHFNEDGTPNAGHEDDYLGPCIVESTATPTNTATATFTATPSNTPTATFTATPSNTPTATFTPTATEVGAPTSTPTATATATEVVTQEPTATPTLLVGLGVPEGNSEVLIPVTGADLSGGSVAGKVLLSLGFGFLGLGIVSYGLKKKQ